MLLSRPDSNNCGGYPTVQGCFDFLPRLFFQFVPGWGKDVKPPAVFQGQALTVERGIHAGIVGVGS